MDVPGVDGVGQVQRGIPGARAHRGRSTCPPCRPRLGPRRGSCRWHQRDRTVALEIPGPIVGGRAAEGQGDGLGRAVVVRHGEALGADVGPERRLAEGQARGRRGEFRLHRTGAARAVAPAARSDSVLYESGAHPVQGGVQRRSMVVIASGGSGSESFTPLRRVIRRGRPSARTPLSSRDRRRRGPRARGRSPGC